AVTRGPGLVGALLTGISYAKGLALGLGVPLIGVHHMAGHIAAGRLARPTLELPYVCLVVSGGHTMLLDVTSDESYKILGKTRDDAAGEAFDKAARILGLGYPGGPAIDAAAEGGDPHALALPRAKIADNPLDFSFSGLKTALLQHKNLGSVSAIDAAASFRQAIVEVLIQHSMAALESTGHKTLVIAGGVAANAALRQGLAEICQERGIDLVLPPKSLCTDNAAMIGVEGWRMWENGEVAGGDMDAVPCWPLAN
ncbi:MAG: tRNA (adenosine(37)-N6)-threonylcarbamoyltransferase complex transferase subunit TsaD, partial [Clostridia bacterium]|nr:tRNA (adenosine(37)-N6)-threonylcarbamoyltransferase complex transferase subunit TsaD [Clostridia bacterium]